MSNDPQTDEVTLDLTFHVPTWGSWPLPGPVPIAWGARALYRFSPEIKIDLLADRQEMVGGTPTERRAFATWVDNEGLPAIKAMLRNHQVDTRSKTAVEHSSGGYTIKAGPRGSSGYLYIMAWRAV